ncbi:MAG: hypothetical protein EXQ91_08875 [Alphaproteobacteria bacterium]|nr:hypothetical protein [Alphaproteobacteria bacterium]
MDVASRQSFFASIRELSASGKTVLFTTHHIDEADALARRVVVIDGGVIVADASPAELRNLIAMKRVRFRLIPPLGAGDLDERDVISLKVTGERVSFLTAQPEAVLAALFARGARVSDLEVIGASLEEAIFGLTLASPAP